MSQQTELKNVTNTALARMKKQGEKIVSLTAYDASFAGILDDAGVEMILVGDSLGMVVQGESSTVPVTIDEMIYHTRCVAKGIKRALLIADMPFMSYPNADLAAENAAKLMQQGHAHMVKLEGGKKIIATVEHLVNQGIPVCGHLGLLPQSVNQLGGYLIQGKSQEQADIIINDAIALERAGASAIVVECVPAKLGKLLSEAVLIPIIGIGAGVDCDGQVLVSYDMLDITQGKRPKFSHDFMADTGSVSAAVKAYVDAVKSQQFPRDEHSF